MAQHVPRPRDAEGFREGGDFAVLAAGRNDPAAAAERSQPRGEIVADRDDAAGGCLRLTGPHLDDAAGIPANELPAMTIELQCDGLLRRAEGGGRD